MSAKIQATGVVANYSYDPLGRRYQKVVTGGSNAGTTVYLNSGDDEIAEYGGANGSTLKRRFIPGPSVDRPIAMIDNLDTTPVTRFFYTDRQGSVVAMSDASGNLTEGPYTYDAYGNCLTGGQTCSGGVPYKYTGRRYDAETGLYYYRARYYSPALGRFLQTDPIGYKDDLNWYAYVGNDPTDKTDPTGEAELDHCFSCHSQKHNSNSPSPSKTLSGLSKATQTTSNAISGQKALTAAFVATVAKDTKAVSAGLKGVDKALGPIAVTLDAATEVAQVSDNINNGMPANAAMAGGVTRFGTSTAISGTGVLLGGLVGTAIEPGGGTVAGGMVGGALFGGGNQALHVSDKAGAAVENALQAPNATATSNHWSQPPDHPGCP